MSDRDSNLLNVYKGIVVFMLILVVGAGLPIGAGAAIAWGAQIPLLLFVVSSAYVKSACCCCIPLFANEEGSTLASQLNSDIEKQTTDSVEPPKPKKPRMHWLDNIKTFLIFGVVLGHTGMAVYGAGAGLGFGAAERKRWFDCVILIGLCIFKPLVVPLFFFISGFFSP